MSEWHDYRADVPIHTVTGTLLRRSGFSAPRGQGIRDLLAWLPPGYESGERRYPVVYMHDGQNLFDAHTSYSGEWQVDESMTALHDEGLDAIIVGLPHAGENRRFEYSPYPLHLGDAHYSGYGDDYLSWLIDSVKPQVDGAFLTLPDAAHTGIAGSSMGGLISLHGIITRPDAFGFCAAFSTAYWLGEHALRRTIESQGRGHGMIYLDVGTREGDTLRGWNITSDDLDTAYVAGVRELRDALLLTGYKLDNTLVYVEDEGAAHSESAWARRFPFAMRHLLNSIEG